MAMMFRIALIASLALSPVLAQGAELTCVGETGPLLTVGSKGVNRLELAGPNGGRVLELERWSICFRCVGFPRLDLMFKGVEGADVAVFADARICDGAGESAPPERYCIANALVRSGDKDDSKCHFPKGTTLGTLWTALTQSPPPESIDLWWSYPAR
jgi:hypothetical protein